MTTPDRELNRLAITATAHCLTGCAIGQILGLVIGTALGWGNAPTIVLAVALAFVVTVPVDRALIRRGKGHAVVHRHH